VISLPSSGCKTATGAAFRKASVSEQMVTNSRVSASQALKIADIWHNMNNGAKRAFARRYHGKMRTAVRRYQIRGLLPAHEDDTLLQRRKTHGSTTTQTWPATTARIHPAVSQHD
jgi:hypothetical protein